MTEPGGFFPRARDAGITLLTVALTFSALAMTWRNLTAGRERRSAITSHPAWREIVRQRSWAGANPSHRDTFLLITDYQCPACKAFAPTYRAFTRGNAANATIVTSPYAIESIHKNARALALLSLCRASALANDARDSVLYEIADTVQAMTAQQISVALRIVSARALQDCRTDTAAIRAFGVLQRLSDSVPIRATPTLIHNGTIHVGGMSLDSLQILLRQARK